MEFMNVLFALYLLVSISAGQESPMKPDEEVKPYLGVGVGFGWIQDYPGADQGRTRYLVIPTYKSKHFTMDRQDGIKGELLENDRFQFSVSFSFLFPTDSKDIPARAGMPDLGWTLQLGPELRVNFINNNYHRMFLRLPLRFVANTDFNHHFDYLDWNFAPSLRNVFQLGPGRGEITTRLELDYASEAYNDLFYEVSPQYATANRPAYDAKTGLMEYIVGINYAYYDFFPWTFFAGGNVYFLQNAKNRESPLLLKTTNFAIIGGIVHYF
jgi:MipA family protein